MEIIFGGISMPDAKDFDGFYILPHREDDGLRLSYFDFNDDFEKGKKIDHTSIGDMYHVVFLTQERRW